MAKKFKEWRNKLTWQQVRTIVWIVGILIGICWLVCFFPPNGKFYQTLTKERGTIWHSYIAGAIIISCGTAYGVYKLLNGAIKQSDFNNDKLKEKFDSHLKEDEFTEVYLKEACRYGANKIILDGYDAHRIKYFAKKQGDNVYIVSKENGEQLKPYPSKTWEFFEKHFTFTKEEE